MKKVLSVVFIFLLSCFFYSKVYGNSSYNYTEEKEVDYYYIEICSFCKKLDQYIEKNDISGKIKINKINVHEKKELFIKTVEELGLNEADIGVPFLVYTENGEKKYVKGGYVGGIYYFSNLLEQNTISIESKKNFKKQKIISKTYLSRYVTNQKYIITIDELVLKASDKKLLSVAKKLEKISYIGKSEKITQIFQYLEAKILEEMFKRGI